MIYLPHSETERKQLYTQMGNTFYGFTSTLGSLFYDVLNCIPVPTFYKHTYDPQRYDFDF